MKICLIGSTRFMGLYREFNIKLTLAGHIVYSVCTASTGLPTEREEISEAQKQTLDLVHLRKIMESDCCVLVTDDSLYAGFSTRREMEWATMLDKPLYGPKDLKHLTTPMPFCITGFADTETEIRG